MFVGRNLLCKVTDFGFFSNNCHLCVEIFILDIRIQKWQLLFDSTKTYIFFDFFSCYEKRLHSPFLPLHRQNKDSESRRHITKPKGSEGSNPSASALWLVSSVGSEHDATNVGVGSSSLSRVTTLEVWQSWSIAPVLKTGRRQRLKGSNPLASANLPYRITVVRQILDLQVVVRFHLGQHQ